MVKRLAPEKDVPWTNSAQEKENSDPKQRPLDADLAFSGKFG